MEVLSKYNCSGGSSGNAVYMQWKCSVNYSFTAPVYSSEEKTGSGHTVVNQWYSSVKAVVKWYVRNI